MENFFGRKCIIRSEAGVFYGELKAKEGKAVIIANFRKLWYWSGAQSVEDLAVAGVTQPENCKFTRWVPLSMIEGVTHIIPCEPESITSIEAVPIWKA